MLPDDSIASKLIDESFKISNFINFDSSSHSRSAFFSDNNNMKFYFSLVDYSSLQKQTICSYDKYDTFINQTFLYDMLIISKLYAIIYRLYYYHYNTTLMKNESQWDTFCKNAIINIISKNDAKINTYIDDNTITINNLFDISNLNLSTAAATTDPNAFSMTTYNKYLFGMSGNTKMDDKIAESNQKILYHMLDGSIIQSLNDFYTYEILVNKFYSISLTTYDSATKTINNSDKTIPTCDITGVNTFANKATTLKILETDSSIIKRDNIKSYYNNVKSDINLTSDYLKHRVYIYLEAFNTIFNTDSSNILDVLKYNMYYYNLIVYNVSIQYSLVKAENERIVLNMNTPKNGCYNSADINKPYFTFTLKDTDSTCPPKATTTSDDLYTETLSSSSSTTTDNLIQTIIEKLIDNINSMNNNLNSLDKSEKITSIIIETTEDNKKYSKNFYYNQEELNKTINEYNEEFEKFNNMLFYYKLIIIFSILLIIIIFIINFVNSIDKNSKIAIYSIIIILTIIVLIIYNQFIEIKENFTVVITKNYNTNISKTTEINSIIINKYKETIDNFINNLLLSCKNFKSNGNLKKSISYIKNLSYIKNEKAELYKIKKMNLSNSIEIIKKTNNYYYNIIILLAFCIIILNIGLILYLVIPNMIIQNVVLSAFLFIILVYYISYNIQKSTQLAENKNYWSNYNPSSNTLSDL